MNDRKTSELGSRVRTLLSDRGVTQTELAERTGIDRAELNRLINGRRSPRSDEIQRLADALGVATTELVVGVELTARAEESLAAFAKLEAKAAEGQQRAEVAEARLARLVSLIDAERQANVKDRIAVDAAFRTEQARLRDVHCRFVEHITQRADRQAAQDFSMSQASHAETVQLRSQLAQMDAALVTVTAQRDELRRQLAGQAGKAAAEALFGLLEAKPAAQQARAHRLDEPGVYEQAAAGEPWKCQDRDIKVLKTRVRLTWWSEAGSITAESEDPLLCAKLDLAPELRIAYSDAVGWRRAMEGLERDLITLLHTRAKARVTQDQEKT